MKVFIAGPRAIKELDDNVCKKLENICNKNYEVLIGDANGVDSTVQHFLSKKNYKNVTVFVSGKTIRNNYGNWLVHNVYVDSNIKGFDFYAKKDYEMARNADIGFMIWNGESKGTFNNIMNLLKMNKEVVLYYKENSSFYYFKNMTDFIDFVSKNIQLNSKLKQIISDYKTDRYVQVKFF